jgi:hypothetical protein
VVTGESSSPSELAEEGARPVGERLANSGRWTAIALDSIG